jgi:hypothetical protein
MLAAEEVETYISDRDRNPPNVSGERLQKYFALMKDISAVEAFCQQHTPKHPSRVGIVLWSVGFAGDGAQSGVCWTAEMPTRQVRSIDNFYRDSSTSVGVGWVSQRIDSN